MGAIVKKTIKFAVFMLGFLLIANALQSVLQIKYLGEDQTQSFNKYESLQENSLDVLFVGSSNIYCAVNPLQIYNDIGVTSFVLGNPLQQVPASAVVLENALESQKPELVVFEVRSTAYYSQTDEDKIHQLVDHLPFSVQKYESVQSMKLPEDDMLYLMSPLLRYHTRWKSLTQEDFLYAFGDEEHGVNLYGFYNINNYFVPPLESYYEPVPNFEISEENIAALDKIKQLCDENNAELLFIKTPTEEWRSDFTNAVQNYADENGIEFIDTNTMLDEIGIDKTLHFADYSHFNTDGAKVFTNFVANYLTENYSFTDKTNSDSKEQWAFDYDVYLRSEIAMQNDLQLYLQQLNQQHITAILTVKNINYSKKELPVEIQEILNNYNLSAFNSHTYEHAAMAILSDGQNIYTASETHKVSFSTEVNGTPVSISADVQKAPSIISINYETVLNTAQDGLNIVVYDTQINEVLDIVNFSIYSENISATRID